jgi:uncharacterized membrane protein
MTRSIVAYLASALAFVSLDFMWLSTASPTIYQEEIGTLLLAQPKMVPAVLFYALYLVGVVVFVVRPALAKGELSAAATKGALFGVIAYATYDLTNLATLEGFTAKLALIDIVWGGLVTGVSAGVGYLVASRVGVRQAQTATA